MSFLLLGAAFIAGLFVGVIYNEVLRPYVTSAISEFERISAKYDAKKAELEAQAAAALITADTINKTIAIAEAPCHTPSGADHITMWVLVVVVVSNLTWESQAFSYKDRFMNIEACNKKLASELISLQKEQPPSLELFARYIKK